MIYQKNNVLNQRLADNALVLYQRLADNDLPEKQRFISEVSG